MMKYSVQCAVVMEQLKFELKRLVEGLPPGSKIAYIDQPIHLNVGDLLINMGLESLLSESDLNVDVRLCVHDYDRFKCAITSDHIIILHGGGNFGDIWPEHESLRQKVLRDFKGNKVILFPQTVHFNSMKVAKACARAYLDHPDFTMYVRDPKSAEFVEQHMGITCRLAPDTAHQLWNEPPLLPSTIGAGKLRFFRRDLEAPKEWAETGTDWNNLRTTVDRPLQLAYRYAMALNRSEKLQPQLIAGWYRRRDALVERSAAFFMRHDSVITSRLHGAILGALVGIDVEVVDNSYGKLSRYCDHWMPNMVRYVRRHEE